MDISTSENHWGIASNISLLNDGKRLIQQLTQDQFTQPIYSGASSISAHFRHIIDHYQAFIKGFESKHIDYTKRDRDAELESDPQKMQQALENVILFFKVSRFSYSESIHISEFETDVMMTSTVSRELQFLISHTIHHYAMIKVFLKFFKVDVDDHFGLAPSTIRFLSTK